MADDVVLTEEQNQAAFNLALPAVLALITTVDEEIMDEEAKGQASSLVDTVLRTAFSLDTGNPE